MRNPRHSAVEFLGDCCKKTAYLLAVCLCRLRRQVFRAFGKQKEIFSENMRINGSAYSFCAKKLSESAIKGFLPQHAEKQRDDGVSVNLCKLLFIKSLRIQKIQAIYFKISALYFEIHGLYFLRSPLCFFRQALWGLRK